jgi:hypothetical protein
MASGAKRLKFRGALSSPVNLWRDDAHFRPERVKDLYENNEGGSGGWYPLGANLTWHNGIHLHGSRSDEVYAIADGTIVAARLGEENADGDKYPFGSPRFVLVKHELSLLDDPKQRDDWDIDAWKPRDVEFYSLYMHLDATFTKKEGVPWLQTYLPYLRKGVPATGPLRSIFMPEGPTAKHTSFWSREPQEVDGKVKRLGHDLRAGSIPVGTVVELLQDKRPANPARGYDGPMYQQVRVLDPELHASDPVWIRVDGSRLQEVGLAQAVQRLQTGDVAALSHRVRSGECIGHLGHLAPEGGGTRASPFATYGVHVEVFSKDVLIADADKKAWTILENDTDDDVICDERSLLAKVKDVAPALHESLYAFSARLGGRRRPAERRASYSDLDPKDRAALRRVITKNSSFWSIDWGAMMKKDENKPWRGNFGFDDQELKEFVDAAQRYMWWGKLDAGVLPAKSPAIVYHYHPVALLEYLGARVPRPPVFYINRNAEELVVSKPDPHLEPSEKVLAYDHHVPKDSVLGKRSIFPFALGPHVKEDGTHYYIGLEDYGPPNLRQFLLKGAQERDPGDRRVYERIAGIPSLPEDERRIWAAIWHSEGGLYGAQTYDNGFLSVGPVQQTAGILFSSGTYVAEGGEYPAALQAVREMDETGKRLVQRYFADYGFDPIPNPKKFTEAVRDVTFETMPPKGNLAIRGTKVVGADHEKARWFIWSWCYRKAMDDLEFRERFLRYGLSRLAMVRALAYDFGGETVRMHQLIRSELGQALVLDLHINLPGKGRDAVRDATKVNGVLRKRDGKVDWQKLRDEGVELEHQMIKRILAFRDAANPAAMPGRAAFIVLCMKGLEFTSQTWRKGMTKAQLEAWNAAADAWKKRIEPQVKMLGYASVDALVDGAGGLATATENAYGFLGHERPD